jgi:hypothetical protein
VTIDDWSRRTGSGWAAVATPIVAAIRKSRREERAIALILDLLLEETGISIWTFPI